MCVSPHLIELQLGIDGKLLGDRHPRNPFSHVSLLGHEYVVVYLRRKSRGQSHYMMGKSKIIRFTLVPFVEALGQLGDGVPLVI